MHSITELERESLIDLLLELQERDAELYLEISEGLSILGYDEEPEEDDLNDEDYDNVG